MPAVNVERAAPHICLVTLNRPERLNAMSLELVAGIHDALDEISADRDNRVIVLTGAGRGFCAGLDLKDLGTMPAPGSHWGVHAWTGVQEFIAALPQHMRAVPQIIIAAVNGPAYGGGLSLALSADLRIAGESAAFCSAYIRTGLTGTDIGNSYLLPRLIGAARGFDMIITGRTVDAAEAGQMGLVSRVVPDDKLLDEALATAASIASYSGYGLQMTKEALWANLDAPNLAAAIAMENRNQMLASQRPEFREYQTAFQEKRPPKFE